MGDKSQRSPGKLMSVRADELGNVLNRSILGHIDLFQRTAQKKLVLQEDPST